jgi:hypothetical protein
MKTKIFIFNIIYLLKRGIVKMEIPTGNYTRLI